MTGVAGGADLPELPEPALFAPQIITEDAYTATQVRLFAREAVEALDALLTQILNRRVKIEQRLLDMAAGKVPMPDAAKLREMAVYLGTPTAAAPSETPRPRTPG